MSLQVHQANDHIKWNRFLACEEELKVMSHLG